MEILKERPSPHFFDSFPLLISLNVTVGDSKFPSLRMPMVYFDILDRESFLFFNALE